MSVRGALAALLGIGACVCSCLERQPTAATRTHAARHERTERKPSFDLARPHVPTGAEWTIRLLDAVGSSRSSVGDRFRAVVEGDARAATGAVLVRDGALVEGTVVRVSRGPSPLLGLDLRTVETTSGPATVFAKLRGATNVALPDEGKIYIPETADFDLLFTPHVIPGPIGYATPGTSTFGADYYDEHGSGQIEVPAGSRLRIVITRPLVPP